jgi:signal transduction histidine kinase
VYPKAKFELRAPGEIRGAWDPDRLGQVISNLASNAAQYARIEEPIAIELAERPDEVMINVHNAVRDTPIDPATLLVLFEPFRRGHATGHHAGLGLGLYIVHAIITAHRGSIAVESTHAGTVFRVVLPRR